MAYKDGKVFDEFHPNGIERGQWILNFIKENTGYTLESFYHFFDFDYIPHVNAVTK